MRVLRGAVPGERAAYGYVAGRNRSRTDPRACEGRSCLRAEVRGCSSPSGCVAVLPYGRKRTRALAHASARTYRRAMPLTPFTVDFKVKDSFPSISCRAGFVCASPIGVGVYASAPGKALARVYERWRTPTRARAHMRGCALR